MNGTEQAFSSARQPAVNDGPKTANAETHSKTALKSSGHATRNGRTLFPTRSRFQHASAIKTSRIPAAAGDNLPFPNTTSWGHLSEVETRFLRIQLHPTCRLRFDEVLVQPDAGKGSKSTRIGQIGRPVIRQCLGCHDSIEFWGQTRPGETRDGENACHSLEPHGSWGLPLIPRQIRFDGALAGGNRM